MQWSIFDEIQGVWIADETLSLMFEILHETLSQGFDLFSIETKTKE